MYNVTTKHFHWTTVAAEKRSVIYSECVSVALEIQHELLMCHIVVVACPAV
jgi:propanediol utilization protein